MRLLNRKSKKMRYSDWLDCWMEQQRKLLKESTAATYTNMIENHIRPHLGKKRLDQLDRRCLQQFLFEMLEQGRVDRRGGLAYRTVQCLEVIVKASLSDAMEEGVMPQQLLNLQLPRNQNEKAIQVLSRPAQARIEEAARSQLDCRSLGIVITMNTGLRIGELCALKWEDINLDEGLLTVRHTLQRICAKPQAGKSRVVISAPKTQSSRRVIPLNRMLKEILPEFAAPDDWYVISGSVQATEPRTYRAWYSRFLARNHIEHLHFHCLRHTFATRCIELGADVKTVSELLGHASVNTTMDLYVHPRLDHKKFCVELLAGKEKSGAPGSVR